MAFALFWDQYRVVDISDSLFGGLHRYFAQRIGQLEKKIAFCKVEGHNSSFAAVVGLDGKDLTISYSHGSN